MHNFKWNADVITHVGPYPGDFYRIAILNTINADNKKILVKTKIPTVITYLVCSSNLIIQRYIILALFV